MHLRLSFHDDSRAQHDLSLNRAASISALYLWYSRCCKQRTGDRMLTLLHPRLVIRVRARSIKAFHIESSLRCRNGDTWITSTQEAR
jgi:hypothetical protein